MRRPLVSLLTDFGFDGPAAIVKAVVLRFAPDAQVVDISHTVSKFAIRDGAFILRGALPWFPIGVHVGVVDPGVGTERLPVALRVARGDVLVGPDNGLLVPAAERLGGIAEARAIENPEFMLPEVSGTFHGRDIFAPTAGRLAAGARFEDVGAAIDPERLVRVAFPAPVVGDGVLETAALYVDSFGNVRLGATPADLGAALGPLEAGAGLVVEIGPPGSGRVERVARVRTFGEVPVGASLLYVDSFGQLALADNQGSFARRLGIERDARVAIRRA
ncbi:MAG TPA: SAM-dependent chlorinase/fluorinase [Candidatus Limnocylindrales bacterium]|nr:SAM-dependent chlorinase/fluorinase [Candidatus Limnocylindrales bacterium]